jgi:dipeptidyl-peptidase 4
MLYFCGGMAAAQAIREFSTFKFTQQLMQKKNFSLLWLGIFFQIISIQAQQKRPVTFDDIWLNGTFAQKTVQNVTWMKNGGFYTALKDGKIIKYRITDGAAVETLFDESTVSPALRIDGYTLSSNERKILLSTERESIYRRSSKAIFYVYDLASKTLVRLSAGKQSYATFAPDGSKVAFCRDNDLFYVKLDSHEELKITFDGKPNSRINGSTDWVYEEEFGFAQAFWWSPDSRRIAYLSFDESEVREYNMQTWGDLYPRDYRFKYPKAGEANAKVSVSVFEVSSDRFLRLDTGTETDQYLPRVTWTQNSQLLSVKRLNRLQNKLEILHLDVSTGKAQVVLTESAPTYVDLEYTDDLVYLADGQHWLATSEKSGYKHLYLYNMAGEQIRQITQGNWEVADFLGMDEKNKVLYYLSTEDSPMERQLYSIGLDGNNKRKLSTQPGMVSANFSSDFSYLMLWHSAAGQPLQVSLHQAPSGKLVKVLEDNAPLKAKLQDFEVAAKSFFNFQTSDGQSLNGWMIKPQAFDPNKKYPVLMFVYGGPGSQTVKNEWADRDFFWYQIMAQKGFVVVSVDGRGTGARGREFKHSTYENLGRQEVNDQIEGAKYLSSLSFVDKNRIGIWGWSYGGYMSSLCILLGQEVFKAAVAVAPVTSWRFYDTIYTERYLKTPQLNAKGYDDFSPLSHVAKLKGKYLLIHGTGDDNVHFQNAMAMQEALIRAGKQFESFFYPNKNHGISGGQTRLHLYKMMTDFWEKNL